MKCCKSSTIVNLHRFSGIQGEKTVKCLKSMCIDFSINEIFICSNFRYSVIFVNKLYINWIIHSRIVYVESYFVDFIFVKCFSCIQKRKFSMGFEWIGNNNHNSRIWIWTNQAILHKQLVKCSKQTGLMGIDMFSCLCLSLTVNMLEVTQTIQP